MAVELEVSWDELKTQRAYIYGQRVPVRRGGCVLTAAWMNDTQPWVEPPAPRLLHRAI